MPVFLGLALAMPAFHPRYDQRPPIPRSKLAAHGEPARDRLVVFSDDWGRHPSSCQYLIRELLARYNVDWINTIGMRSPRPDLHDLARAIETVRGWTQGSDGPAASTCNPRVFAPVMLPSFGNRLFRHVNLTLLEAGLRSRLEGADGLPPAAAVVTTVPLLGDLVRRTRDLNWTYYCADEYAVWPGAAAKTIHTLERELLEHVKRVVVTSKPLLAHVGRAGREAQLLTHGVDLDHWKVDSTRRAHRRGRPVALFWGMIDRRLCVSSCLALAKVAQLVLVGACWNIDKRLRDRHSVELRGRATLQALPDMAAEADVLVMPYVNRAMTRAMQPLKLKEYLATGLPVLAPPLPAVREWSDALDVCETPADYVRRFNERAGRPLPESQRRARERLSQETWAIKSAAFERMILPGRLQPSEPALRN